MARATYSIRRDLVCDVDWFDVFYNCVCVLIYRLVHNLTTKLDAECVEELVTIYREIASSVIDSREKTWLNSDRAFAGHQLAWLLSLPSVQGNFLLRLEQLKFFFLLSFTKTEETENVGAELAGNVLI